MIEIAAVLIALTVLAYEYALTRKPEKERVCKVWVQENRHSDWICIDRKKR